MTSHRKDPIFIVVFGVMLAGAAFSYYWLGIDIAVRLGWWSIGTEFDANAFTAQLSVWNDIAFYTVILATPPSLYWAWAGSSSALVSYALVILAGVIDWILLNNNAHWNGGFEGYLLFSGQLFAYVYLVVFALRDNPGLR